MPARGPGGKCRVARAGAQKGVDQDRGEVSDESGDEEIGEAVSEARESELAWTKPNPNWLGPNAGTARSPARLFTAACIYFWMLSRTWL